MEAGNLKRKQTSTNSTVATAFAGMAAGAISITNILYPCTQINMAVIVLLKKKKYFISNP